MKPVIRISGPSIALPRDNIDTDQLIPARFMSRPRSDGYGDQLFYDLRFNQDDSPVVDFPLNRISIPPKILVVGDNFGCGSSREAAVYALLDHGIGAVIAAGFADIFRGNAVRNGLLTVVLREADRQSLLGALSNAPGATVTVDLESCLVTGPDDMVFSFDYDPAIRSRLLKGLDDLSATLEHETEIACFTNSYLASRAWILPRSKNLSE